MIICPYDAESTVMVEAGRANRVIQLRCPTCHKILFGPHGKGTEARFWASVPNPKTVEEIDKEPDPKPKVVPIRPAGRP